MLLHTIVARNFFPGPISADGSSAVSLWNYALGSERNAVHIPALPCGNFGVTPGKRWGCCRQSTPVSALECSRKECSQRIVQQHCKAFAKLKQIDSEKVQSSAQNELVPSARSFTGILSQCLQSKHSYYAGNGTAESKRVAEKADDGRSCDRSQPSWNDSSPRLRPCPG